MGNNKGSDIWVKDLDRDTPSRLRFLPSINATPVWTPDRKNIVFRSQNPAAPGLFAIRSDGSGEAKRLTEGKPSEIPYSFSPDGKRLAIFQRGNGNNMDIFTMAVAADSGLRLGKAELFLGTPFIEVTPAFSPDGRWLAYASNESGTFEVYVRPFPGPKGRWQVSTGGGRFPLWSRDGPHLHGQGRLVRGREASSVDGDSPEGYRQLFQLRSRPGRQSPRGVRRRRCKRRKAAHAPYFSAELLRRAAAESAGQLTNSPLLPSSGIMALWR